MSYPERDLLIYYPCWGLNFPDQFLKAVFPLPEWLWHYDTIPALRTFSLSTKTQQGGQKRLRESCSSAVPTLDPGACSSPGISRRVGRSWGTKVLPSAWVSLPQPGFPTRTQFSVVPRHQKQKLPSSSVPTQGKQRRMQSQKTLGLARRLFSAWSWGSDELGINVRGSSRTKMLCAVAWLQLTLPLQEKESWLFGYCSRSAVDRGFLTMDFMKIQPSDIWRLLGEEAFIL